MDRTEQPFGFAIAVGLPQGIRRTFIFFCFMKKSLSDPNLNLSIFT